jgi:hypothetical protein
LGFSWATMSGPGWSKLDASPTDGCKPVSRARSPAPSTRPSGHTASAFSIAEVRLSQPSEDAKWRGQAREVRPLRFVDDRAVSDLLRFRRLAKLMEK